VEGAERSGWGREKWMEFSVADVLYGSLSRKFDRKKLPGDSMWNFRLAKDGKLFSLVVDFRGAL